MEPLNFSDANWLKLYAYFALEPTQGSDLLDAWLSNAKPVADEEGRIILKNALHKAKLNHLSWNEYETTQKLIGPILQAADLDLFMVRFFGGRNLKASVNNILLKGIVDGVYAFGVDEPTTPYFCLAEYKQTQNPSGDPSAQCAAEMLAAQALNNDGLPVYGAWFIGGNFHFAALQGRAFQQSRAYSALNEEIYTVAGIFAALKPMLKERLKARGVNV